MTNQETIANLNMIRIAFVDPVTKEQRKLIDDTFEMAIKALEQESLTEEDYIELRDRFGDYVVFVVKDMISDKGERWTKNNPQEPNTYTWSIKDVADTLAKHGLIVEQEPKTGHWINIEDRTDWYDAAYNCSCCGRAIITPYELKNNLYSDYPYCHCGAKMVEE